MKQIENKSNSIQCISWMKAFEPKEIRQVSDHEAEILLWNHNFAIVWDGMILEKGVEETKDVKIFDEKKTSKKKK